MARETRATRERIAAMNVHIPAALTDHVAGVVPATLEAA
jgi:hypothetical protein